MPPKSAQLLTAAASPDMRSVLMSNIPSGSAFRATGVGNASFMYLLLELKGQSGQVT